VRVEERRRQLEGPGHAERLNRLRKRFRALADAREARLAAARLERRQWLHKPKGRTKSLALAETADASPTPPSARQIETGIQPPRLAAIPSPKRQRKSLSFALQLGLVIIASAASAWMLGAIFPPDG
jgi:hypothetical protein